MVIPRFVSQALRNEPLTVYGDGKQTRTFTYVKDVVHALIGLAEADNAVGEVFNIGGTEEVSMLDLANKIIKATGSTSKIEIIAYDKVFGKDFEDMLRRVPGIEKINQCIGFDPKTDLDEILKQVVAFMK